MNKTLKVFLINLIIFVMGAILGPGGILIGVVVAIIGTFLEKRMMEK